MMGYGQHLPFGDGDGYGRKPERRRLLACTALASTLALAVFLHGAPAFADEAEGGDGGNGGDASGDLNTYVLHALGDASIGSVTNTADPTGGGDGGNGGSATALDGVSGPAGSPGVPATPGENATALGGDGGNGGSATGGIEAVDVDVGGNITNATKFTLTGGNATAGAGGEGGAATGAKGGFGGTGGGGGTIVSGNHAGDVTFPDGIPGAKGGSGEAQGGNAGSGGNATGGDAGPVDIDVGGNIVGGLAITATSGTGQGGTASVENTMAGGAATSGPGGKGGDAGSFPIGDGGTITEANIGNNATFSAGGTGGAGGAANAIGGQGGDAGDGTAGAVGPVTIAVGGTIDGGFAFDATGSAGTGGDAGEGGDATAAAGGAGGAGGGGGGFLINGSRVTSRAVFGDGGEGGTGGNADATGGDGGQGGKGTGGAIGDFSLNVGGNASIGVGNAIDISGAGGVGTGGAGGQGGDATATAGGAGGIGAGGGGLVDSFASVGGDAFFGDGGAGGAGGSANAKGGAGGHGGDGLAGGVGAVTVAVAGDIDNPVDIVLTGGEATGGAGAKGGNAQSGAGGAGGHGGGGGGSVGATSSVDDGFTLGVAKPGGAGGNANATGGAGGQGGAALGGALAQIKLDFTGTSVSDINVETVGGQATGGRGGDGGDASAAKPGLVGTDAVSGTADATGGAGGAGGAGLAGDHAGLALSLGSNTTVQGEITLNLEGNEGKGGDGGAGGDATTADADPGKSAADATAGAGGAGGAGDGGDIGPIVIDADGHVTQKLEVIVQGGTGRGGAGGAGGKADAGNGGSGVANSGVAGGNGGKATAGQGGDGGDATGGDVTVQVTTAGTLNDQGFVGIRAQGGDAFGGTGGDGGQALGGIGGAGGSGANGGTGQAGLAGGAGGNGGEATGGNGGAGGDATAGTARVTVVNDGNYDAILVPIKIVATGGNATAGAGGAGGDANDLVSGDNGAGGKGGNGGDSANGGTGGDAGDGGAATAGDGGKGGDAQGGDAIVDVTNNGEIRSTSYAIVIEAIGGDAIAGNGGAGGKATGRSTHNGGDGGTGMPADGVGGNGGGQGSLGDVVGGSSIGGNARGGNADVTVTNNGTILAAEDGIVITTSLGSATGGNATGGSGSSTRSSQPGAGGTPGGSQGPFNDDSFTTAGGDAAGGSAEGGTSTVIVKNAGTMEVDGAAVRVTTNSANSGVFIDNSGMMQGGFAGVLVQGADSGPLNQVLIDNSGFLSADTLRAVDVKFAQAHIVNTGTLKGLVDFALIGGNVIDNNEGGVFEARGNSRFGRGDVINNNGGLIHTAENPDEGERVEFQNLGALHNNGGVISLVDGGADTVDILFMAGNTAYTSTGGVLAVDAFLAPEADGGKADKLDIIGGSFGVTRVVVNLTNPQGSTPNFDGIPVARATGFTTAGDFVPEGGVINAGFFAWDIKLSTVDLRTHLLYTTGLGTGAYEFAAGTTAAQDIWTQTVGSLLQRQADLRALMGTTVTPVADFAEPVEPTSVSHVTPGLWARIVGSHIERDGDTPDPVSTDREQDLWGAFAGFDFGTENLFGQGDALMFGLLGGYTTSDLDFDQTGDEWNFEGPSVGVYATYLDHQFYIDAMVKADFLDIDIDADGVAPGGGDADSDVFNIGGQIDTGYKFLLAAGMFLEPQASLAVVHTEIDDIDDIFGGAVEFDDETKVSGRLGLRLGHETTGSDGTIYSGDVTASLWENFTGDNDVTVEAPLFPSANISDDPGSTYGDMSVGFNLLSPDGWSGFARANWTFAEDYDAVTGNVGVRIAW